MPVVFDPGKALELLRYGKFTLTHFTMEISSSEANTNTERDPDVTVTYSPAKKYNVLTERFNWGNTSRPDKVYYELHNWGKPFPPELLFPEFTEGYYCGAYVDESNMDNRSTHIYASESIDIKLWNVSDPAEDVYIDFTVWYYKFHENYSEEVFRILRKTWELLEEIKKIQAGK